MIKVGICEDNIILASTVEHFLDTMGKKKLIVMDIDVFSSGEELYKIINDGIRFDIIYLEIDMKRLNGIETAKRIRKTDPNVIIIYISNYENNLMELFEVEPFRLLKKPINEKIFGEYFDKACEKIENEEIYFDYKFNKTITKVLIKNIIYFESRGRTINIIMKDSIDRFYGTLNQLEKKLLNNKFSFLRIHQSYLVNYKYIEKIGLTKLKLMNGIELRISEDRRKNILENYGNMIEKN
jgi:DNA-binding LytR/AlgR family response regulator